MSPLPEVLKGLQRFEQPVIRLKGVTSSEPVALMPTDTGQYVRVEDVTDALRGEEGEAREKRLEAALKEILTSKSVYLYQGNIPGVPREQTSPASADKLRSIARAALQIDRSSPGLSGGDYAEEQNLPTGEAGKEAP